MRRKKANRKREIIVSIAKSFIVNIMCVYGCESCMLIPLSPNNYSICNLSHFHKQLFSSLCVFHPLSYPPHPPFNGPKGERHRMFMLNIFSLSRLVFASNPTQTGLLSNKNENENGWKIKKYKVLLRENC